MTLLEHAIAEIASTLDNLRIEYMVIGGIANAVWGEPRATIDVDVTVTIDEPDIPAAIEAIARHLKPAVPDPVPFVGETRVLPLDSRQGVRIDLIFALLPFEIDAVRRARPTSLAGRTVRVATPEDLVLMKIISERERDLADAEAIVRRRRDTLDVAYLAPRVRELAMLLERPEILERWERWTAR